MKKKIYVASSWRNTHQPAIVEELRILGYDVYDFRHPDDKRAIGFQWSKIDPEWEKWTMEEYRKALMTDYAQFGFNRDFDAMKAADICVLVLPCGRSAHLEAGWMRGAGKKVIAFIWSEERIEPELMYGLLDGIAFNTQELAEMLSQYYRFGICDKCPSEPSISSVLDEAAEKYSENILANNEDLQDAIEDAYKAGWRDRDKL